MLGFRYIKKNELGDDVLEGVVYETGKEEEYVGFMIKSEERDAKIIVNIFRGPPTIKCLDFFRNIFL